MTKRTENSVSGKKPTRSCNLPGCDITDDLIKGLCPEHDSTHRGLADPDPIPEPVDAPVLNEVGGTPIPADKPKKD